MVSKGIKGRLLSSLFLKPRILKFKLLSGATTVEGRPILNQPVLFLGAGTVRIGDHVNLGYAPSPYLYSGYIHIEARKKESRIEIGNDVWINNDCAIVSEGKGIYIGARTLIGTRVQIFDSDFHDLDPDKRLNSVHETEEVRIGENAFIGSNTVVLKGVSIGKNSVIGHSSVVTQSIPDNVVAAGNPCKVLKTL